jgi:nucleotide-binding universal stress UspA family protein
MEVFVFGNGFVEEDERGLKLQSPSCRMGRPDEEIVVVGEEIGADLIAMGGCGL